ncbi:MAG: PQQ-binding-like beta-propeller repeat protein [bacterium]|nr:PQQ-binding-like beta-propeller repeat protein [bacterium]
MKRHILPSLCCLALTTTVAADDWPQFRGPNRDGISAETGLLRAWPEDGPTVLWSLPMNQGYAAAAIHSQRVVFHDYDSETSEWLVKSVTLDEGRELWTYREARRIRPNHGITRTVPALDGKHVFSLDPKATFHCLDAETGKEIWRKNLVQEYGTKIPPWYNGQCPLLDGDRVLVAPGGSALVVAFDKATGDEAWRTPNPEGWPMSHASLMPARLGGVDQLLYSTLFGAHGIAAADGKQLWHFPFKFNISASPSPLALDGERVYITAGYDSGGAMLRVRNGDGSFTAEEVFVHAPDTWNSEVQTPIVHDGHFFAVGKKKRGLFTCLDGDGKAVWTSEGKASFGLGSFLLADGMFFILEGRTGMLRLLEASTTGYQELASAQVLGGHDVWAPLALSGGKLVIRDLERMVCLQVGK